MYQSGFCRGLTYEDIDGNKQGRDIALGFQNVLEPLGQLGHEVIWAADFSQLVR